MCFLLWFQILSYPGRFCQILAFKKPNPDQNMRSPIRFRNFGGSNRKMYTKNMLKFSVVCTKQKTFLIYFRVKNDALLDL